MRVSSAASAARLPASRALVADAACLVGLVQTAIAEPALAAFPQMITIWTGSFTVTGIIMPPAAAAYTSGLRTDNKVTLTHASTWWSHGRVSHRAKVFTVSIVQNSVFTV